MIHQNLFVAFLILLTVMQKKKKTKNKTPYITNSSEGELKRYNRTLLAAVVFLCFSFSVMDIYQ